MPDDQADANVTQAVPFLRVADMPRSMRFYVDGLSFRIQNQWTPDGTVRWCWLERGGAALMLQDFRRDDGSSWEPGGPLGLGVSLVFICADALAIYHEARARGLEPSRPFVGNAMWVTTLRDPDGYRIEFESPTDAPEETVLEEPGSAT
jgi:lactoylglutathione lyase